MIFYKIRHKVTGEFSKGGTYISERGSGMGWGKTGKTWDTLGKLRSHITCHLPTPHRKGTDMRDWEVLEYTVAIKEVKGVKDVIDPKKLLEILGI